MKIKKTRNSQRKEKYEQMSAPKAQLDFHDFGPMQEAEIVNKVRDFISECASGQIDRLLIITGKGYHSKNGQSVVKPLVERTLRKCEEVDFFADARRDRGGEGAIEVKLN